ncbi:uncharacterized protein PV09_00979 [Verruconis gallopava]|uniref:Uncharacterized protein n=1 Tax=Verruconis gallopava TaxID=253628 RepID=A0A0D2ANH8_9PEZI|nr:uncharacterized protein PV09_00979 [Verruconis gallopava]KIW08035.1 hypothetical protein PV09_00979 [Verruconis gallopava]
MPQQTNWVKVVVTLLLGFQLGLLLGFISSTLMFKLLPQQWIDNGFADRKSRYENLVERRTCRKEGFREMYSGQDNRVSICACWQDGAVKGIDGGVESCWAYERSGWSELGV